MVRMVPFSSTVMTCVTGYRFPIVLIHQCTVRWISTAASSVVRQEPGSLWTWSLDGDLWQPLFFNILPDPSASRCRVHHDSVGRAFAMQARWPEFRSRTHIRREQSRDSSVLLWCPYMHAHMRCQYKMWRVVSFPWSQTLTWSHSVTMAHGRRMLASNSPEDQLCLLVIYTDDHHLCLPLNTLIHAKRRNVYLKSLFRRIILLTTAIYLTFQIIYQYNCFLL